MVWPAFFRAWRLTVLLPERAGLTWLLSASMLLAVMAFTPRSAAQPSAIDKDTARTLVNQGDARFRQGDLEGALEAYLRADEIMGVPTTGIEVGRLYRKLGRFVEAKAALLRVTRHPPKSGEPRPFTEARKKALKWLRTIKKQIPRVSIELTDAETGQVIATEGVTVIVDGALVDTWEPELEANPGEREFVVAAPGYKSATKRDTLFKGGWFILAFALEREVAPVAADAGTSGSWVMTYVGFGGAVAFGAAGAVTGVLSLQDAALVTDQCVGNACPSSVQSDLDRSRMLAHVSTGMFVATGVAAAVGSVGLVMALGEANDESERADKALGKSSLDASTQPMQLKLGLKPGGIFLGGRF